MIVGNKVKGPVCVDQSQGRFDHTEIIADVGCSTGLDACQSDGSGHMRNLPWVEPNTGIFQMMFLEKDAGLDLNRPSVRACISTRIQQY
jgi:hypothetical protein